MACSGSSGPTVGPVDDLVADLLATGEEALLVGDGALRYRERICAGARRIEFAEQWLAHPSAAPLVQLAHAKALREEWVQPGEVQPLYLRQPDAEINWVDPGVGAVKILPERTGLTPEPRPCGTVRISPMRRRHVRSILKIEQQVYPRPWSAAVFASEIDQIPRARRYLVAHVGRRLVGYGGLLLAPDSAHVTNIAVDPGCRSARASAPALLLALARDAIALGAPALTLEVRVGNVAAQQLYRRFGFAPAGMRKRYYEGTGRRHRHVGPRHRSARLPRPPRADRGEPSAARRNGS